MNTNDNDEKDRIDSNEAPLPHKECITVIENAHLNNDEISVLQDERISTTEQSSTAEQRTSLKKSKAKKRTLMEFEEEPF